jgi:hypothetical protein
MTRLEQLAAEMKDLEGEITMSYTKLQDLLNAPPVPQQLKSLTDSALFTDKGRWCLAWARQGYNVFDLSQDFTAAMLLTDPTALDIREVKLPFQGLLVIVPAGFAVGAEGLPYTKIHVWQMPKCGVRLLDATEKVMGALEGLPASEQHDLLQSLLNDRTNRPHSSSLATLLADDVPYICIHATDGVHAFSTFVEVKNLSWKTIEDLPDNITDDTDRLARHAIQQIVFGMLAYMNTVNDAATPRAVQHKTKRPTAPVDEIKHWDVGRTVTIDPQLVRAARGGSREISFRIKNRFIVRGHYRNQAHGPRRSERTLRWVAPFWKGPEEGARLVHTYQPKLSDEDKS